MTAAEVVLVTGASRGIGQAIAAALAAPGALVVGTATSVAGAAAITAWLKERGLNGRGAQYDALDPEGASALRRRAICGFHLSGKWLYRASLEAVRGDYQISVPLTHSGMIRVRDRPNIPKPATVSDAEANSAGLVDALIAIEHERQRIMEAMRAILLRGDDDAALEHARELTGLPTHKSPVSAVTT